MRKERSEPIEIVSGTNLGMLVDAAISRTLIQSLSELCDRVLECGQNEVRRVL